MSQELLSILEQMEREKMYDGAVILNDLWMARAEVVAISTPT